MHVRKNSRAFSILKNVLVVGGVLIVASLNPTGGHRILQGIIKEYTRKKKFMRNELKRDLRSLSRHNLLSFVEKKNGEIEIRLKKKGEEKILQYNLEEMKIKEMRPWDHVWRIVTFDIPHNHKKARDVLRRKLQHIGMRPLQKSIFITPFPCEDEIEFLASIWNVKQYVLILHTQRFEGDESLKRFFAL